MSRRAIWIIQFRTSDGRWIRSFDHQKIFDTPERAWEYAKQAARLEEGVCYRAVQYVEVPPTSTSVVCFDGRYQQQP